MNAKHLKYILIIVIPTCCLLVYIIKTDFFGGTFSRDNQVTSLQPNSISEYIDRIINISTIPDSCFNIDIEGKPYDSTFNAGQAIYLYHCRNITMNKSVNLQPQNGNSRQYCGLPSSIVFERIYEEGLNAILEFDYDRWTYKSNCINDTMGDIIGHKTIIGIRYFTGDSIGAFYIFWNNFGNKDFFVNSTTNQIYTNLDSKLIKSIYPYFTGSVQFKKPFSIVLPSIINTKLNFLNIHEYLGQIQIKWNEENTLFPCIGKETIWKDFKSK